MGFKLHKTIVMVGMMGAGKTAIGTALARSLCVPFLDSDAEIERAANRSVAEIFNRDGEAFFRDRETQVIARLLETTCGVLSTGGGAFMSARNRELISEKGVAVWLQADLELLWARVKHKDSRPLLRTVSPRETLATIKLARDPVYAQADLKVLSRPEYSIPDMVARVRDALLSRPDVLTLEAE
ncbi:MAG: shikimate kinase [Paracoccaceae bacterium]